MLRAGRRPGIPSEQSLAAMDSQEGRSLNLTGQLGILMFDRLPKTLVVPSKRPGGCGA